MGSISRYTLLCEVGIKLPQVLVSVLAALHIPISSCLHAPPQAVPNTCDALSPSLLPKSYLMGFSKTQLKSSSLPFLSFLLNLSKD